MCTPDQQLPLSTESNVKVGLLVPMQALLHLCVYSSLCKRSSLLFVTGCLGALNGLLILSPPSEKDLWLVLCFASVDIKNALEIALNPLSSLSACSWPCKFSEDFIMNNLWSLSLSVIVVSRYKTHKHIVAVTYLAFPLFLLIFMTLKLFICFYKSIKVLS